MFDEDDLAELTASVREKGIIQPILVRTVPGHADAYEIIAGERRWRAAQRAELHDVPIVTIEADDKQALEIAIIENVQRTNLNALEEAQGYERLGAEFGYSQGNLAKVIGKSRPHVNKHAAAPQTTGEGSAFSRLRPDLGGPCARASRLPGRRCPRRTDRRQGFIRARRRGARSARAGAARTRQA